MEKVKKVLNKGYIIIAMIAIILVLLLINFFHITGGNVIKNIVFILLGIGIMFLANKFIINKLLKKLSVPEGKAPLQLKDFGNSSNASIPLLMCTSIKEDALSKRLKLYISGFGVGLSLGVGVITIGALKCADIIEL